MKKLSLKYSPEVGKNLFWCKDVMGFEEVEMVSLYNLDDRLLDDVKVLLKMQFGYDYNCWLISPEGNYLRMIFKTKMKDVGLHVGEA